MTKKTFSVVIPSYNRRSKVLRAVTSVVSQTNDDWEIILVDDGSADGTLEAVAAARFPRLRYIRQVNQGAASARNTGIAAADGKYVAFLDSDDWWFPTKLDRVLKAFQEHPDAGLVHSHAAVVDDEGRVQWIFRSAAPRNPYRKLIESDFIYVSAAVVRRDCLDEVGAFERLDYGCEDWELWCRIARHFQVVLVPEVLVAHEYGIRGSRSANLEHWLSSIEVTHRRLLAADNSLTPNDRARAYAAMEYTRGTILATNGMRAEALTKFREALSLRRTHWKAAVYLAILSKPRIAQHIPKRFRTVLKLPA